jgi:hypothetical protein
MSKDTNVERSFWDMFTDNLGSIGSVITLVNPVAGLVVKSIDAIVNSENEKISNDSTIKVLESISKSTGNDVDDVLINIVKTHLANKVR